MKLILAALLIAGSSPLLAQKSFQLLSPDNQLKAGFGIFEDCIRETLKELR